MDAITAGWKRIIDTETQRDELLAALKAIVDFCDDPNPDPNISLAVGLSGLLPAARAAIEKAKATSPTP